MVHRNRVDYRGSGRADIHLGYGVTVRPNTLKQTAQESKKLLANRAGHTFPCRIEPAHFCVEFKHLISNTVHGLQQLTWSCPLKTGQDQVSV
ncbi:hypothetical protein At1D1460_51180 (plasmid) [Agrobacterium tumefaciens]|nr:hypothetical protein At1D1460_51180 [Agrobacterium tumefaciens]